MSDNFGATIDDDVQTKKGYKKTQYLALKQGEYTIRILDPMETRKETHYVGYSYIECLGDECPICQNNKKILYEHPEDYKDVQGWCPRRPRFYLNVIDKADGLVKVLSCGPMLIEDLKTMSRAIRNEKDERIDIRHYDWTLIVKGEKREKTITPSHKFFGKEDEPNIGEQALYDLSNVTVKLSPDEMLDAFNGASLKDIFAVRRAKKEALDSDFPTATENVEDEIKSAIDQMFGG
jgi:hypothetical protein